jgi:regulator of protease activity HflC (stomatin/prohibitin superfamily)
MSKDFWKKHGGKIVAGFVLGSVILGNKIWLVVLVGLAIWVLKNKVDFKVFKGFNSSANSSNFNNMAKVFEVTPEKVGGAKRVVVGVVVVIGLIWLLASSLIVVEAGETGVYSLFGKVRDEELSSGIHLVNPLGKVTKMSIRTEEYTMSAARGEGQKYESDAITSLTKEGLNVDLDMTVWYRLNEAQANEVYENFNIDYEGKIIRPAIRTAIRDIVAQYQAKDIYSEKRQELAQRIEEQLAQSLEPRGIIMEDVLLRNVALPSNLANAIQEKLQAEQEAQKYEFILDREQKERERKLIEAEGQRDAQRIINESLSQEYLHYLYINGLQDREGTIYVPTDPNTGLPLFRGVQ